MTRISHNVLYGLRVHSGVTLLFLIAIKSFLLRRASQLLLHSCPIETNDALFKCSNIIAVCVSDDNSANNDNWPLLSAFLNELFDNRADDPLKLLMMLSHCLFSWRQ